MEDNQEVLNNVSAAAPVQEAAPVQDMVVETVDSGSLDDTDEIKKAKTYPINEDWPDEIKQQVQQLNQMAEMMNSAATESDDESEEESEADDSYADEESSLEDESAGNTAISTEETESFENVF